MTPSTSRLLIAIATYNERESLPNLLATVRQVLADVDILVIDDNSPDGTGTWVDGQAARDPRLHVQHRPAKLGLGTATIAALEYALVHGYDAIVTLDADGSHDPKYIPALLQRLGSSEQPGADVVVGSRYVPGGGIIGWPWYRLVMSRMVNAAARILLGLAVHDCSGAFRAMRVAMIRRVELHQVRVVAIRFLKKFCGTLSGPVRGSMNCLSCSRTVSRASRRSISGNRCGHSPCCCGLVRRTGCGSRPGSVGLFTPKAVVCFICLIGQRHFIFHK